MTDNQAVLLPSGKVTYLKDSVSSKILAKKKLQKKFTSHLSMSHSTQTPCSSIEVLVLKELSLLWIFFFKTEYKDFFSWHFRKPVRSIKSSNFSHLYLEWLKKYSEQQDNKRSWGTQKIHLFKSGYICVSILLANYYTTLTYEFHL